MIKISHPNLQPRLFAMIVLFSCSNMSGASEKFGGYRFLMHSDPMFLRLSDNSELKLVVTANTTRHKDTLAFSVNDKIVAVKTVTPIHRRADFEYSESGFTLRVQCIALDAADRTVNHTCTVFNQDQILGKLKVEKRLYPVHDT